MVEGKTSDRLSGGRPFPRGRSCAGGDKRRPKGHSIGVFGVRFSDSRTVEGTSDAGSLRPCFRVGRPASRKLCSPR
jgi:hypothetical protein